MPTEPKIMPVILAGAGGRMGGALLRALAANPALRLAAAIEKDKTRRASLKDLPVPIGAEAAAILAKVADSQDAALIDFTSAGSVQTIAAAAADHCGAYIVGTTGLAPEDEAAIKDAARKIPVLRSGNMSLGAALLQELTRRAAEALDADWDIEILDMHHAAKKDAPSGTALLLGEAAAKGRGSSLSSLREDRKAGVSERQKGAIGFASLRGGTMAGEHSVIFAGRGEHIRLHHSAETRDIFARGALKACLWARGRKPGLYTMADVLDFS